jgi:hypothetical protein
MNNFENLITEKYLDGILDDIHYIELMEAVDDDIEYVDAEFVDVIPPDGSKSTKAKSVEAGGNKPTKNHAKDTIVAVGLTGVTNLANTKMHQEMKEKYIETKKSYNENVKNAKKYINSKKFDEAKKCISDARKDIDKCEKIIKDSDDNFLGWLAQQSAGDFNDLWLGVLTGTITSLITKDEDAGLKMSNAVIGIKKVINVANMVKYNRDAKGLGNVLNKQRANMLATLNFAKKTLDRIEKNIPRD